jgi:putative tryptophan/tyrosine transport system substrate-binding protein
MKRRHVIAGLGATVAASPFAVNAQQKPLPVLGFLISTVEYEVQLAGIRQGLAEAGFVEGQTIAVEYRHADDAYDKLPAMAADLVARKVDVIIAQAPPAARAAKAATTTIPIVFGVGIDPVADGLVASLARPDGNLTGVSLLNSDVTTKRLGLLLELTPKARRMALLLNPTVPNPWLGSAEELARAKGVQLLIVKASNPEEVDAAIATVVQERVDALIVGEDTFLVRRRQIAEQTLHHRLPSISPSRFYAERGGLASYGTNIKDAYRIIGTMAGRILNGAKPADLPVQQPVRFEMVLNMKTAKALDLEIPPQILVQASELIE